MFVRLVLVLSWFGVFLHCSLSKRFILSEAAGQKQQRKLSISVEMPVFRIIYSRTAHYLELISELENMEITPQFVNGESKFSPLKALKF